MSSLVSLSLSLSISLFLSLTRTHSIYLLPQLQRRAQPPVEIRRFVDAFVDGFCNEYAIHSSALRAIAALLFARVVFPRLLLLRCVRFDAGEEREALANDVRLQAQLAWMRRLTPQELGVNPLVRRATLFCFFQAERLPLSCILFPGTCFLISYSCILTSP